MISTIILIFVKKLLPSIWYTRKSSLKNLAAKYILLKQFFGINRFFSNEFFFITFKMLSYYLNYFFKIFYYKLDQISFNQLTNVYF